MPKTVAYLRVSTNEQDTEKNKYDVLQLANDKGLGRVEWIEEKVSSRVHWRKRQIGQLIDELESGDNMIVPELSRLGRSMLEVMEILSICASKEIRVFAVKGSWQLDSSIQSKVMAMIFAMAAELERDFISARTKEALAARRASGMKLGRPVGRGKSKLDKFRPEIEALLQNGSSVSFIAARYKTTRQNLSRWIKVNKVEQRNKKQ